MTKDRQKYEMTRKRKIIAGCVFCAIIFFVTLIKGGAVFPKEPDLVMMGDSAASGTLLTAGGMEIGGAAPEPESSAPMVIDVAGAVSQPGIRIVPEGSRVYEVLEEAGGVLPDAELQDINLAEVLLDGQKLYIPSAADYAAQSSGNMPENVASVKNDADHKKININSASLSELQTLKGVGPATAERILDYRSQNGKFKKIEDLKNVKGIGEKTFEKLRDFISVT